MSQNQFKIVTKQTTNPGTWEEGDFQNCNILLFKITTFKKIYKTCKKPRTYGPYVGNKAVNRNCPCRSPDIGLIDKNLNHLL